MGRRQPPNAQNEYMVALGPRPTAQGCTAFNALGRFALDLRCAGRVQYTIL